MEKLGIGSIITSNKVNLTGKDCSKYSNVVRRVGGDVDLNVMGVLERSYFQGGRRDSSFLGEFAQRSEMECMIFIGVDAAAGEGPFILVGRLSALDE